VSFGLMRLVELARIAKQQPSWTRYPSRTDMLRNVLERDLFTRLSMTSPRRHDVEIVIGACELRTGSAFRFGNHRCGSWRLGDVVSGDRSVAFSVAASAAYPIFLPALDRTWTFRRNGQETKQRIVLTDGGVYDNLGVQVLEPDRDPDVSLHTFPCEYLIVCNAGVGLESGESVPTGFFDRVQSSFALIHRRVQDASMRRLHQMRQTGAIRGFAMPYLGQRDERLPWKPGDLVERSQVVGYPTDFAAMSNDWIDRLSTRGEQLTRVLISNYLADLLT